MITGNSIREKSVYIHQLPWLLRSSRLFKALRKTIAEGRYGNITGIRFKRSSGYPPLHAPGTLYFSPDWISNYQQEFEYDLETLSMLGGPLLFQSARSDPDFRCSGQRFETEFLFTLQNGKEASYTVLFAESRNRTPSRTLHVSFEKALVQLIFVSPAVGGIDLPDRKTTGLVKYWTNNLTYRCVDLRTGIHTHCCEARSIPQSLFSLDPDTAASAGLGPETEYRVLGNS